MTPDVRRFLEHVAHGGDGTARAQAMLDAESRRKARKLAKSLPRRKVEKVTKWERRQSRADIRASTFIRAAGRCECCRLSEPTEWHHLLSGGLRRHREAVDTTTAICTPCHQALTRGDLHALGPMYQGAGPWASKAALDAIQRRIDKAQPHHKESAP